MTILEKIEQIRNETDPYANTTERVADVLLAIFEAFPVTLPASDVYPWAKQPTKPTYFVEEVGAEPSGSVSAHNLNKTAHPDIRELIKNGGETGAVISISVNGVRIERDSEGNVDIVIEDVQELKEVGDVVTELVDLNIFNRVQVLEFANPEVRVNASLVENQDGNREIFTLNKPFITGTTQVWVNGIKLTPGLDYTEIANLGIQFVEYAPKETTDVQILITEKTVEL